MVTLHVSQILQSRIYWWIPCLQGIWVLIDRKCAKWSLMNRLHLLSYSRAVPVCFTNGWRVSPCTPWKYNRGSVLLSLGPFSHPNSDAFVPLRFHFNLCKQQQIILIKQPYKIMFYILRLWKFSWFPKYKSTFHSIIMWKKSLLSRSEWISINQHGISGDDLWLREAFWLS